jgi:TRAP-type C4-dicarboxylate transport system substrate-binding protein
MTTSGDKTMNARTRIKTLIAGAALASLGLGVTAQAQTTTLTLSSWVPPTHYLATDILQPWIAEVEKATEGRVKINVLPKAVGSPPQHWELARKGVADITWGNFTYEPERFKHVWFAELPMMGSNCEATSVALWRTYSKFLADNDAFKGVHPAGRGPAGRWAIPPPEQSDQHPGRSQGPEGPHGWSHPEAPAGRPRRHSC